MLKSEPDSLPMRIEQGELQSGRIYLPCVIDGQERWLHLDTGSNYTSVPDDEFFGRYRVVGQRKTTGASGISKMRDEIQAEIFRFGSMSLNQKKLVRYPHSANQEPRLGMDVLAGKLLKIDFKKRRLTFEQSIPNELSSYPIKAEVNGQISMAVRIAGIQTQALWDTGAEISVGDEKLINAHPSEFSFLQEIDNGLDATGEPVKFKLYEFKNLKMGDFSINGRMMAMDFATVRSQVGHDIQILLGFNLIQLKTWHLDLLNFRWAGT